CDERGEIMDRNDVAFGVLSERKKWMRCPKCRHCVELVKGCNMVRCRIAAMLGVELNFATDAVKQCAIVELLLWTTLFVSAS
ncbi:hypothetical protein M8C21_016023, partial [Ambrosia artemisiifolia]